VTIEATLDAGSPRVAFAVSVDNRPPITACACSSRTAPHQSRRARADTAFDVITRRRALPCRTRSERVAGQQHADDLMVDAGDAETGATVIGKG
jgi:hypothetical protein